MVMGNDMGVAHELIGVKVYVVVPAMLVLMVAGLHVPVIPLSEVVGNAGAVGFWHSGAIGVNAGVSSAVTVMVSVAGVAHCPADGVNVYVVGPCMDVLMVAGLQVPVIPLMDVVGKAGAVLFKQSGAMVANVGVMAVVTSMFMVVGAPHWPGSGVNV